MSADGETTIWEREFARLSDADKLAVIKDQIAYGTAYIRDGKRIDPGGVYLAPTVEAEGPNTFDVRKFDRRR